MTATVYEAAAYGDEGEVSVGGHLFVSRDDAQAYADAANGGISPKDREYWVEVRETAVHDTALPVRVVYTAYLDLNALALTPASRAALNARAATGALPEPSLDDPGFADFLADDLTRDPEPTDPDRIVHDGDPAGFPEGSDVPVAVSTVSTDNYLFIGHDRQAVADACDARRAEARASLNPNS